jgi:hypothetical protein
MIVIKIEEFEMVQVDTGPFFNFSALTTINAGKENERKEMKLIAYGIPFETCMKQIVGIKMGKQKEFTGNVTVHDYIEKYKQVVNEVSKLITHVEKIVESKEDENNE